MAVNWSSFTVEDVGANETDDLILGLRDGVSVAFDPATITAGTGLAGGGIGDVTLGLGDIDNNTGLVNLSGGPGAPDGETLTAWIDAAIGYVQGSILYRDISAWLALTPGTAGEVLTSGGAAANPVWQTSGAASPWTFGTGADSAFGGDGTTTASGDYALAYGNNDTSASSANSFAFGNQSTIDDASNNSILFGANSTITSSSNAVALGSIHSITGSANAFAAGYICQINNAQNGIAIGSLCVVNAESACALGTSAVANYEGSFVICDNNGIGIADTAEAQFVGGFNGGYYFNTHTAEIPVIAFSILPICALQGGDGTCSTASVFSMAYGFSNTTIDDTSPGSLAFGTGCTITGGTACIALGSDCSISGGQGNIAMGDGCTVNGTGSVAIGVGCTVNGEISSAFGLYTTVNYDYSFVITDGTLATDTDAHQFVTGFMNGYYFNVAVPETSDPLLAFSIDANGNMINFLGECDLSKSIQTPSSSDTINLSTANRRTLLNPGGTLSSLTLVLPYDGSTPPLVDGQLLTISTTQIVSSLTVSSAGTDTVLAAPSALTAGQVFTMLYDLATTSWYPA